MRMSWLRGLVAAQSLSLLSLASCGGSSSVAAPAPPPVASAVEMLSSAEQSCEAAQRLGIPVHCRLGIVDGVPSVVMEFPSHDEADKHAEAMTKRVGRPFCDEADGLQPHAAAIIMAEDRYRSFDCAKRQWSEWARGQDAGSADAGLR
jgi:hypothetical protein